MLGISSGYSLIHGTDAFPCQAFNIYPSLPLGFISCPFQSCALHPPALVLHHHLQCGEALHEEQTARESKTNTSRQ